MASCHCRATLSIFRICFRGWEEHPVFDMLLTEAKFPRQQGNQNGGKTKNYRKEKDSCSCEGSAFVQLNKSEVLFHVVSLAALLHTLYIALFLPAMSFIFNFCGIKKGGKENILARV